MTQQLPDQSSRADSGDDRPNSGLREGDISHAEVNEALRQLPKTIIFGQQNRLRDGVLIEEDERLDRFHAGHDLVRFFYGAVRQLPDYLVDALLANGVSITLVKSDDLLVFQHARAHQSFHTGRTRKTIYMPQLAIHEASQKGYDYWAISEVIIEESWALLDYLLILELIRRCQQHLHEHYTLGHAFVRGTLDQLNRHRKQNEKTKDNEFQHFFDHYKPDFFRLGPTILDADPYDLADEMYDEPQERTWASNKLYDITEAFSYPTYYSVDRDIIHPTAFRIAGVRGLPVAPETIDDILHDLGDSARFGVGVQVKSDELMDMLIERGEPGIRGYLSLGWDEGRDYGSGFYPTVEFRRKLQALSSSPPEGSSGSISGDFNFLLNPGELESLNQAYRGFDALPFRRKKFTVLRLLVVSGTADLQQLTFEVEAALLYTKQDDVLLKGLAHILFEHFLGMDPSGADFETHFMGNVLRKLDRHRHYHTEILAQLRALLGMRTSFSRKTCANRLTSCANGFPTTRHDSRMTHSACARGSYSSRSSTPTIPITPTCWSSSRGFSCVSIALSVMTTWSPRCGPCATPHARSAQKSSRRSATATPRGMPSIRRRCACLRNGNRRILMTMRCSMSRTRRRSRCCSVFTVSSESPWSNSMMRRSTGT